MADLSDHPETPFPSRIGALPLSEVSDVILTIGATLPVLDADHEPLFVAILSLRF